MSFPCWSCGGSGEATVSRDNDPQNDRQVLCDICNGSGYEPCCNCSRDASAQAWAKERPQDREAHLLHYCAEHLEQDRRQGLIVLVVDGEAAKAVA
jgi:hypothetical protein